MAVSRTSPRPRCTPALARLLAAREVIGLRNPGHSLVKLINPCAGAAVVVSSYTHPRILRHAARHLRPAGHHGTALTRAGGRKRCRPAPLAALRRFVAGTHQLLDEQQPGTASEVPGLPSAIDVDSTARYTRDVLEGRLPVPAALAQQMQHIVRLAQLAAPGQPGVAAA